MADRGMRSFSQVVVAILALVTKLRLALVTKLCIALVTKLHSSRYQALLGNDILEALLPVQPRVFGCRCSEPSRSA